MKYKKNELLDLSGKTAIITGGAGLLGIKHAEAIAEYGGTPILLDIDEKGLIEATIHINKMFNANYLGLNCDITDISQVNDCKNRILDKYNRIDILINNAAIDPKVRSSTSNLGSNRLENFSLDQWNLELSVGLTGAFICVQVFGNVMVSANSGVIVNISSDLGIIAPDQRLYEIDGVPREKQSVKPVTYSVIKHGLIGLTKYIATYWAKDGIRANTLCPAGVFNNQPPEFVEKISNLIPMGRMAERDEYKATIVYLTSDASSYMNGHTLILDGGRSIL